MLAARDGATESTLKEVGSGWMVGATGACSKREVHRRSPSRAEPLSQQTTLRGMNGSLLVISNTLGCQLLEEISCPLSFGVLLEAIRDMFHSPTLPQINPPVC